MTIPDLPLDRESLLAEPATICAWLQESDPARLSRLWETADRVRRRYVGDEVFLRAIIEFSNYCVRRCAYCGIRAPNTRLARYRMNPEEIAACAARAMDAGIRTIVLQAGEDPALDAEWVAGVIRRVKSLGPVAITLSLGERSDEELLLWREAGADRYLLRFETSNPTLYGLYHPGRSDGRARSRVEMLHALRRLDYEVGSGVMIGLPGQTWADLAEDLRLFAELDLDMIGCGPFILHPDTPLGDWAIAEREGLVAAIGQAYFGQNLSQTSEELQGLSRVAAAISEGALGGEGVEEIRCFAGLRDLQPQQPNFLASPGCGYQESRKGMADGRMPSALCGGETSAWPPSAGADQVPPDELTTYKVIALARILCPWANIPATTALATLNPTMGRRLGLRRGANIIMPNFTPPHYRTDYQIYPGKAETLENPDNTLAGILAALAAENRPLGQGTGVSKNYLRRKGLLPA